MKELTEVPMDLAALGLRPDQASVVDHLGRRALRFEEGVLNALVGGVEVEDGVVEVDLCLPEERSFHGVAWRAAGQDFEAFFLRPHQVGNDDAIQYTPNPNGHSSWQLYHGPGYWAPIRFPVGAWCTIRVAFAGPRADIFVDDLATPVLAVDPLGLAPRRGGLGVQVGGGGLHVGRVAYAAEAPALIGTPPPPATPPSGLITTWDVSDAFAEGLLAGAAELSAELVGSQTWTRLDVERSGLANLARIQAPAEGRNTVLARTTIEAPTAVVRPLQLGFSDRATLFLNGRALFHGDETYRNRDYRFLGSIGWWDTVYLPLTPGRNELVVAVAEDFGGWGLQARFGDLIVAPD